MAQQIIKGVRGSLGCLPFDHSAKIVTILRRSFAEGFAQRFARLDHRMSVPWHWRRSV